jgi:tripartite motif-containing protein 71
MYPYFDHDNFSHNACKNRIEKFSKTGAFITKGGSSGSGKGMFIAPTGITVDSQGNIFISDSVNSRIEKWGP